MRTFLRNLCLLSGLAVSTPAAAQVDGYDPSANSCYRTQAYRGVETGRITTRRVWVACEQAYGPRVYGYERRWDDRQGRHGECLAPRSVVGLEKYSLDEAKENATALWMEAVKLHHGAKYMNPANALVFSDNGRGPDCYLAATGNRASEQLAEKASKVLHQCEFRARPCEGQVDEDRGRRR